MLEITCRVTEEVLYAGDTVIFLLHGTQFQEIDNYIILAQCHGHIHIDHRWLKLPKKFPEIISEIPSNSSDQPSNIPNAPVIFASNKSSDNSACVLTTSKIPLATSQLFKDGVFFEFEIPHDAFPSYKGLCATISYYLTITIQQPEGTRLMHYPFTIGGVCDGKAPTYRMK